MNELKTLVKDKMGFDEITLNGHKVLPDPGLTPGEIRVQNGYLLISQEAWVQMWKALEEQEK